MDFAGFFHDNLSNRISSILASYLEDWFGKLLKDPCDWGLLAEDDVKPRELAYTFRNDFFQRDAIVWEPYIPGDKLAIIRLENARDRLLSETVSELNRRFRENGEFEINEDRDKKVLHIRLRDASGHLDTPDVYFDKSPCATPEKALERIAELNRKFLDIVTDFELPKDTLSLADYKVVLTWGDLRRSNFESMLNRQSKESKQVQLVIPANLSDKQEMDRYHLKSAAIISGELYSHIMKSDSMRSGSATSMPSKDQTEHLLRGCAFSPSELRRRLKILLKE